MTEPYSREALDCLAALERAGFVFRVKDGSLLVTPGGKLTEPQRQDIRRLRDALVRLVSDMPSPEAQAALDRAEPPAEPGIAEWVVLDMGEVGLMAVGKATFAALNEVNRQASERWTKALAAKRGDVARPVKVKAAKKEAARTLFNEGGAS